MGCSIRGFATDENDHDGTPMSAELTLPAAGATAKMPPMPTSRSIWKQMLHTPRIVIPGAFLLLMAICAIFAPLIAPYSYTKLLDMPLLLRSTHWASASVPGLRSSTKSSRLIYGCISLTVAVVSVAFASTVGTTLGLIAAYYRGWVDTLVMRLMDILLSFPTIVLAIAIVAMLGPSVRNVIIVIAIIFTPRFTRIVYGATLSTRESEYVQAARVIGACATGGSSPRRFCRTCWRRSSCRFRSASARRFWSKRVFPFSVWVRNRRHPRGKHGRQRPQFHGAGAALANRSVGPDRPDDFVAQHAG